MRPFLACLVVMMAACTPEQSKSVGAQPKKTIDSVSSKVGNAMQQGQDSERLRDTDAK